MLTANVRVGVSSVMRVRFALVVPSAAEVAVITVGPPVRPGVNVADVDGAEGGINVPCGVFTAPHVTVFGSLLVRVAPSVTGEPGKT